LEALAVISRVERRHWVSRTKTDDKPNTTVPLKDINNLPISFNDIVFFNPTLLPQLNKDQIIRLVNNKSTREETARGLVSVQHWKTLSRISSDNYESYSLDQEWYKGQKRYYWIHL
jgi:hypothetical protein